MKGVFVEAFDDDEIEVNLKTAVDCEGCQQPTQRLLLSLDVELCEGELDFTVISESVCCGHKGVAEMPALLFTQILEHLNTCPGHADQRRTTPRT